MRGVQNKTHRKTSSPPEEVPYKARAWGSQLDQQSPLSENLSGQPPLPSSPVLTSLHGHRGMGFLLSDRTRKKTKQ